MSTYLLTCQCGKTVPVEVGQAGEHVACECGAQVEVPTLRKLRHLPQAMPEARAERTAWNARKGVAAAGFILAGLLAGYALWNRITEPAVPPFDPDYRLNSVNQGLEKMTPVESWRLWVEVYQPIARSGFEVFEHPYKAAIEQQQAQSRILQTTLLIIAGVSAAVGLAAAFWPGATSKPKANGNR
jgi:hypothetical protein